MSPARLLAIDGALGRFSAAVLREGEPFSVEAPVKQALELGLGAVDDVLALATVRKGELDALAVGIGPGSFTGIRIAVSYAKALAFALTLPLVGVSSYDVLEIGEAQTRPLLAVVAGRPGIACARLHEGDGTRIRCGLDAQIAEMVAESLPAGPITVCGAAEGVVAALGERGFTVRAQPFPDLPALAVARLALQRLQRDGNERYMQPHGVAPDYGELPAAEVRRARNE